MSRWSPTRGAAAEPPVTITTSRYGAVAECHLCDWMVHTAQLPDGPSAPARATSAWAKHWHRAHTEPSDTPVPPEEAP